MVDTNIRYKQPLFLGDRVSASIWISKLKGASAEMCFEFANQQGDVAAIGTQRGLFVNLADQRPRRISAEDRDRFSHYLITSTG